MAHPIFLFFALALSSIVISVDAYSPPAYQCELQSFKEVCCGGGNIQRGLERFRFITEIENNQTCILFNTSRPLPPLVFGTWEGDRVHVRLVSGVSQGLCFKNLGEPTVGLCLSWSLIPTWGMEYQGCGRTLKTENVICSNRTVTEAQTKVTSEGCGLFSLPVVSGDENQYHLYTQEECMAYFKYL